MARKEARIGVTIWEDRDFLALTAIEQRWYFFLISQKDLTHAGTIPLRERRWAKSSSTTDADELETALRGLEAARFLVIDWDTEEVLVRSLMRRDKVYLQPNVMLAAVDAVGPIASPAIITALLAEVERIAAEELTDAQTTSVNKMKHALLKRANELGIDQPNKGSGNPSANPSPKGTANLPGERGEPLRVSNDSPFPESPNPRPPAAARAHAREEPPPETADEPPGQAERILQDWISGLPKKPLGRMVTAVGAIVREALAEGQDPPDVAEGLQLWQRRGNLGPNVLPSIIHEVANRQPSNVLALPAARASPRESTTDARVRAGADIIAEFEALEAT